MRKSTGKAKLPKIFDLILSFIIIVLYILSKIGDGIIWLFERPGEIIIKGLDILRIWLKFLFFSISQVGKTLVLYQKPKIPKIKIKRLVIFRKPRFSLSSFLLGIILTLVFVFIPYNFYLFLKSLPNPRALSQNSYPVTTKIYDRRGNLLYEIFAEQNRTPIKLFEVPQTLIDATLATEDKEFYYHPGFSPRGIFRAVKSVLFDKKLQGGSTITQQLIKSALLSPERTLRRKVREILLAFWAERIYSKDQILEMYLNQVPYGGTAWGIQAAAENYFGKNVADLTLAESALLAGLPAAPTFYSPFGAHPEISEARKNQILDEMVKFGKISKEEAQKAKEEKLTFVPQITNIKAPHFVMYVRELLEAKYGIRKVEQGGLRVITSLDLPFQEKVQEIVKNQIELLKPLSVGNGAALVTNPKTGEILAMVGSKDYFNLKEQGNVNVVTSLRQPGSSIKVVTYSTALENGFTASSILDDSPITFPLANQSPYSPVNYDGKFHGKMTLRRALGNSYNVPAVKVLSQIGVDKMISYGRSMGIESWTNPSRFGLSLTLGGGEVTMLDMARVYGTLAKSGRKNELLPILKVTTYEGEMLETGNNQSPKQAIKEETAFILSNILSDNNARSDAFGPSSLLIIPGKTVAVKTGTSNDKRDNWTIGYTPSYVVVVWVGNNDNRPMHPTLTSGITGATPIWNEIMTFFLKDRADEPFQKPSGLVSIPCYGKMEYFIAGTQPAGGCAPIVQDTPTPTPTP